MNDIWGGNLELLTGIRNYWGSLDILGNTRFFLYKKHKQKHRARISSFSIVSLRNSVVNIRMSVDLDPIKMFLTNKKARNDSRESLSSGVWLGSHYPLVCNGWGVILQQCDMTPRSFLEELRLTTTPVIVCNAFSSKVCLPVRNLPLVTLSTTSWKNEYTRRSTVSSIEWWCRGMAVKQIDVRRVKANGVLRRRTSAQLLRIWSPHLFTRTCYSQ